MNSSQCQKSLDAMWAAIDELRAEKELEEAQRASELWEGISAGDYVQLSEAQHIAKGGLLLTDEHGALLLKQVQIIEIAGDQALVKNTEFYGESLEWLHRSDLGAKGEPGLVDIPQSIAAKYWEES
jgi:hypothetical protein